MKLTEFQKSEIKKSYDNFEPDTFDFGAMVDLVIETTIDEGVVDFSDDEHGDQFEAYSNIVWDMIEAWEEERKSK
jgi:hypothetical protein